MSCISLKYNDSWLGVHRGIDGIRIKHNGEWNVPEKVFVKLNGAWVETCLPLDPTAITTQFNVSTIQKIANSVVRTTQFVPSVIHKIADSEVKTTQYAVSIVSEDPSFFVAPTLSEIRTTQFAPSVIHKIENSEVRTTQYAVSTIAETSIYDPVPAELRTTQYSVSYITEDPSYETEAPILHEWLFVGGAGNSAGVVYTQVDGSSNMYSSADVTGKKYYELIMTNSSGFAETINQIGATDGAGSPWATGGANLYIRTGALYGGMSGQTFSGLDVSNNTQYGIAMDMDVGRLWIRDDGGYKNGNPETDTGGCVFDPASFTRVSIGNGGAPVTFEVNAGEEDFVYTLPTGFVALTTAEDPVDPPPPPIQTFTFDGTVIDTDAWSVYNRDAGNETVQNDMLITRGLGGELHSGGGVYNNSIRTDMTKQYIIECDFTLVNARYNGSNPILIGVTPYPLYTAEQYYSLPYYGHWLGLGTFSETGISQLQFCQNAANSNPTMYGTIATETLDIGTTYKIKIKFDWDNLLGTVWIDDVMKLDSIPLASEAPGNLGGGYSFSTHISQYETLTEIHIDNLTLEEKSAGYTFDGTVIDTNVWDIYAFNAGYETQQDDVLIHQGIGGQTYTGGGAIEKTVRDLTDGVLTLEYDFVPQSLKYNGIDPPAIGVIATNTVFDTTYYSMPHEGLFLTIGAVNGTSYNLMQFATGGGGYNLAYIGNSLAINFGLGSTQKIRTTFDWDNLEAKAYIDDNLELTTAIPAYVITQLTAAGYRFATHCSYYNDTMRMDIDNLVIATE